MACARVAQTCRPPSVGVGWVEGATTSTLYDVRLGGVEVAQMLD